MRYLTSAILCGFGLSLTQVAAQNLTPDKVLRIHFTTAGTYNTTPDVIRINFGLTSVQAAYTTRRAAIYDCDRLLGTYASTLFGSHVGALNLDPGGSFKSPSSLWTFDNAGTADFTTVVSGAIQGVIDFTIDTGGMTIPLNQVNLNMVRATSGSGGVVVSPAPIVTHVEIVPKLTGPTPGTVGTNNLWTVTGATANSVVFVGIGTRCGPIPVFGTVYDILDVAVFVPVPTDGLGAGSLSLFVPAPLSNQRILMQGLDVPGSGLVATSLSAHTFP